MSGFFRRRGAKSGAATSLGHEQGRAFSKAAVHASQPCHAGAFPSSRRQRPSPPTTLQAPLCGAALTPSDILCAAFEPAPAWAHLFTQQLSCIQCSISRRLPLVLRGGAGREPVAGAVADHSCGLTTFGLLPAPSASRPASWSQPPRLRDGRGCVTGRGNSSGSGRLLAAPPAYAGLDALSSSPAAGRWPRSPAPHTCTTCRCRPSTSSSRLRRRLQHLRPRSGPLSRRRNERRVHRPARCVAVPGRTQGFHANASCCILRGRQSSGRRAAAPAR